MKLSVKSDYAVRAVLALSRHHLRGAPQRVETLASEQSVPANYLVQILIELKSKGIVKSVRGKEGGYLLARPPAEITFGDVLRAVHGQIFDSTALADANCPLELRQSWEKLKIAVNETADSITFQHLIEGAMQREKMYYI